MEDLNILCMNIFDLTLYISRYFNICRNRLHLHIGFYWLAEHGCKIYTNNLNNLCWVSYVRSDWILCAGVQEITKIKI